MHEKKKAAILSTAATVFGSGAVQAANGDIYTGGILFVFGVGLVSAYEYLQVKQLPRGIGAEEFEQIAKQHGERLEEAVSDANADEDQPE